MTDSHERAPVPTLSELCATCSAGRWTCPQRTMMPLRSLCIAIVSFTSVGIAACGSRSGLPDAPDRASDASTGGRDAAPESCDRSPVRAVDDAIWEIPSTPRTNAHAFYQATWDRIAVYGGGPVIASTHYDEPVV